MLALFPKVHYRASHNLNFTYLALRQPIPGIFPGIMGSQITYLCLPDLLQ